MKTFNLLALVVLLMSGCSQGFTNPPEGEHFAGTQKEWQRYDGIMKGGIKQQQNEKVKQSH